MSVLTLSEITIAIILVGLILLQGRQSAGAGGLFGGGSGANFYQKRRGFEKTIFGLTIVFIAAFAVVAILNLVK